MAEEHTDFIHSLVIVEKKYDNLHLSLDPIQLNKYIKGSTFHY